jgi:hypothetical protein
MGSGFMPQQESASWITETMVQRPIRMLTRSGISSLLPGVANDETTLMAYNQATLKYKYLLVYVED